MARELLIYGSGGFGREAAWIAESSNCKVVGFVDDDLKIQGKKINGVLVLSPSQAFGSFPSAEVICAIGNPHIREKVATNTKDLGFSIGTLIHSEIHCSETVTVGRGTVVLLGSTLTTNIKLGNFVQINPGCTIAHDVILGDYTSLAPGVHISGFVKTGRRVYFGTGAVVVNGREGAPLEIADDVVIGAGACVTKSITTPGVTVVGVPARPI